VLPLAVLRLLFGVPSDCRRIHEQLGTLHRSEPCGFGVPLIPADEHAELGWLRVKHLEAQVAGREVILLVIPRVVRDVHLAVLAEIPALGVEHGRRVVIEPCGALLEQARNERDLQLRRELAEHVGARARYRLG
jgi:hypothetical protein